MLQLDHITIIAPTLAEGVTHVRDCLDIDVPFGRASRFSPQLSPKALAVV